jgi:Tfp pilus assembly protein PilF
MDALIAVVYLAFEHVMYKALAALPRQATTFLLGMIMLITGAKTPEYSAFRAGLKKAASNRLLPYSVVVFLAVLLRVVIAVVFITILSAWARDLITVGNFSAIACAGLLLALCSLFWPLLLVALLSTIYLVIFPPALLLLGGLGKLHVLDKLLSEEKQKQLGFALGQGMALGVMLLAWGLVLFQGNFPVNWEKLPPKKVPDGLSAKEYYELAIQYKQMGWTEQAREALTRAIANNPADEYSEKAKRYLQTKLPSQPVAREAEQKNIQGFNQMFGGDMKAAKQTFEELIVEYPNFEWPYSNLASIYLQEKRPQKAKELLDKALQINPNYVNAWRHLSEAYKLMGNEELAGECTTKIAELDSDDELNQLTQK